MRGEGEREGGRRKEEGEREEGIGKRERNYMKEQEYLLLLVFDWHFTLVVFDVSLVFLLFLCFCDFSGKLLFCNVRKKGDKRK
jgi:hypothetical protein